jgi:y4mF family transcriptional regulator
MKEEWDYPRDREPGNSKGSPIAMQTPHPNRGFHNGVGLTIRGVLVHWKLGHVKILHICASAILYCHNIFLKLQNIINKHIFGYFMVIIYDIVLFVNKIITERDYMDRVTSVKTLGIVVKEQRKRFKLTQKSLAGLVGVGNRFIVDLERGKETIEFGKTLQVLKMLGISISCERISHD